MPSILTSVWRLNGNQTCFWETGAPWLAFHLQCLNLFNYTSLYDFRRKITWNMNAGGQLCRKMFGSREEEEGTSYMLTVNGVHLCTLQMKPLFIGTTSFWLYKTNIHHCVLNMLNIFVSLHGLTKNFKQPSTLEIH